MKTRTNLTHTKVVSVCFKQNGRNMISISRNVIVDVVQKETVASRRNTSINDGFRIRFILSGGSIRGLRSEGDVIYVGDK